MARKKPHQPYGLTGMEDPQTEFRLALSQLDEPELVAIRNKMLLEDHSEERDVLAEHLVLHALHVLSEVCRREGASVGMGGEDVGTAVDESTIKLFLLLRGSRPLQDVTAVAARIAHECVRDKRRLLRNQNPANHTGSANARGTPRLRLVQNADGHQKGRTK